jgi:glycosyltransferase involved in cell wall biosynthesis
VECHRVLEPGGWLLVTTPNFARYENIAKLWLGQNPGDQYSGHGPYGRHNREYTMDELEHLLRGVGFQIQHLEARSISLPVQQSLIDRAIRLLRRASRHEQHLFCLARRGNAPANHHRPAWLYRNLPEELPGPAPHKQEGIEAMPQRRKVSLINLNLVALDAVGTCIINQVRFFRRRDDDVRVLVRHPPRGVPPDVEAVTDVVTLGDLISGKQEHFCQSDLYIYHYPSRHELMESIRGIDRGTVIFYYHNVTPPELWGSDIDREELIRGVEGKGLAHYADLCIADSPMNRQELVEEIGYDADRVFVLPLVVDLAKFTPGEPDPELVQRYGLGGQQVLLFVGRMAGNKRIDVLVEALAQVQRQVPNTKLLLVGDHEGSPAYRQIVAAARSRAAELGIADDIVWTGEQKPLPYYRLADVYVTASLHEGFGVPLVEAMACDVPVVASRAGAMPWVVGEAGLLCEPASPDDLAAKVLTVLHDADLRQTLVARGRERVKVFSLECYEAELAEIVDRAATYTLPRASAEAPAADDGAAEKLPAADVRNASMLNLLAQEIEDRSDIALREYQVRSRVPLVGPLIVWVRRNLTSHLREPYLDPTIERQVEVNRREAEWMQVAARSLSSTARRQLELEERVRVLEDQIRRLAGDGLSKEGEP